MRGKIYKSKNGTATNQTFIMLLNDNNNCVILFDNIEGALVGDTTVGFDLNDFELSSIDEMSDFIIANRI